MSKIVLIDGHSILNRAFYGIPDLTNSEGLHTNGVYGFLNIMFKILDEEKPEYLAVAFDLKAPTFRHKMYQEYKGTRKAMPEELREQVPLIKEMLSAMGIPLLMEEGYEADDLLGTLGKRMEKEGMEVAIISGDRDLLQLATEKIKIRIPKTKRTGTEIEDYYAQDVAEKYQVTPLQFIDLKAMMGDAADNIPGLPGIGEKTATKLVMAYGSLENAHEHLEEIKPNKAREAFLNHYDLGVLSKELATIKIDVPVEFECEQARLGNLYTQEAFILCKRLEFKNLLSRFHCEEPKNQITDEFGTVTELDEVEKLFQQAALCARVGFQLIMEDRECLGCGLACQNVIRYIPAQGFVTGEYLVGKVGELIEKVSLVGTLHLKDQLYLLDTGKKEGLYDLALGAYLVNPLKSHYAYEDILKEYTDVMAPSKTELLGKTGFLVSEKEKEKELCACYMAYASYAALEPVLAKLDQLEMRQLFDTIEMPLVYTLFDMEKEGILVKAEELKVYGEALTGRILELEREIYALAGIEFNINSPKQLGVILFEKLELPGGKKTKTGYSTAADVLEKLSGEYPIVSLILEYRQLTKLKSTYADGLAVYIQEDGRIHSTFNQTITATGRISSTEPNLQNIPIRMELGRLIRKVFVPKEGYCFVDADYSQIELRVLAHLSGDEMLIQAYKDASDIHRITASQVFHTPFEEVTDLQRRNAKAVNFGIVYGISSFGLSQDLSITRKEATQYIEQYFKTYPGIKSFLDSTVEHAREMGYVTTMFGRRRPVPELKSSNFMQRSFGERIAMNSPIQGTAADIIKIAMISVNERLKSEGLKSKMILQVHDELLIETAKDEVEQVKQILTEEMEGAVNLSVKLEIDMHTGTNWYEAK